MDVRKGWSSEVGGVWSKFDIGLDESDLDALFLEHGMVRRTVTLNEKFKLFEALSKKYILADQMTTHPQYFDNENTRKELTTITASIKTMLIEIQERHGGDEPSGD